jgi:signal transduction histidine kinase
LHQAGPAVDVYLDRYRIWRRGTADRPQLRYLKQVIPIGVPSRSELVIHLRVQALPTFWGMVSSPRLGDLERMQAEVDAERTLRVVGPTIVVGAALALGFLTLALWSRRAGDPALGWFGVASLAYALWLLDSVLIEAPYVLGFNMYVSAQLCNVATFTFALRYAGLRHRGLEALLWTSWIAIVGLVIIVSNMHAPWAVAYMELMDWWTTPVFIGYAGLLMWHAWRRRSADAVAVAAASTGCTVQWLWSLWDPQGAGILLPYSFALLFVTIGWILVRRFVAAREQAETLNIELIDRVEAKRTALEANYQRMAELESTQAVVAERARIMSDMHDGIGSSLISTLSLVESGDASHEQVAAALRECIDDLRLAIDSLEPGDQDLLPVLGNLRYRLEPRLKARGITLEWQVCDLPRLNYLTPQNLLHVLRILQEAFSNVLKHTHASMIRVATRVEVQSVAIEVSDDGQWFDGDLRADSHGLKSMHQRATALGARLAINPSSSGTTVLLHLPTP